MANVMAVVLFICGAVATILGLGIFKVSSSAVHEIEALISLLIAVCGYGFGTLVMALNGRTHVLETELRALHKLAAEAGLRDLHRIAADKQKGA